jgi:hypothetical protein
MRATSFGASGADRANSPGALRVMNRTLAGPLGKRQTI